MDSIKYTMSKTLELIEPTTLKIVASALIASGGFLFGSLQTEALIGVAMLMAFDTILGVAASVHEGDSITSRRFSRAVVKGIVYYMAISAGYFADLTIHPVIFIQATMIGFVGVTEFISILENMGRLGYQTPKRLLNQLKTKYHDHQT